MLSLRNLSKSFENTRAVGDLDLTVEENRVEVLIGPSGCGKSTTLRLIMGLTEPDSGRIKVNGRSVDVNNRRDLLNMRRRMGYVIQGGGLFPHMTARQNITVMARYLNWEEDRIRQRLSELVDLTHFPGDGLNRYPSGLSGGQKQRVSLMRALMLDPDVLLMDEPLGALDPMIRSELRSELADVFEELNKTVLLVTHDLNQAAFFADRIILMREGRIVQKGTVDQLLNDPAEPFVSEFIRAQEGHLKAHRQ